MGSVRAHSVQVVIPVVDRFDTTFILVPFRAFITFEGNRERLGTLRDGAGASLGLGEVIGWRLHLVSNQGLIWSTRVSLGALFCEFWGEFFHLSWLEIPVPSPANWVSGLYGCRYLQCLAPFLHLPARCCRHTSAEARSGLGQSLV